LMMLKHYIPLLPAGANMDLPGSKPGGIQVSCSIVALSPTVLAFARHISEINDVRAKPANERDYTQCIVNLVPLFTDWSALHRATAELPMPESLREVASNAKDKMLESLRSMSEDMLLTVRLQVEVMSTNTRDEKLKKVVEIIDAEDGLQEASKPIVDDILRCDVAAAAYESFKLFDSKSAQAEALVKALMTAKTTTGSLAVDISSVIDKVTKAMSEPEMTATLESCGRVLGNLTGLQSMFRDLRSGESREGLAKKCDKGIARRKHWSLDPKLSLMLQSISSAQPAVAEPVAEPVASSVALPLPEPEARRRRQSKGSGNF
jgi:hypothetical protein